MATRSRACDLARRPVLGQLVVFSFDEAFVKLRISSNADAS